MLVPARRAHQFSLRVHIAAAACFPFASLARLAIAARVTNLKRLRSGSQKRQASRQDHALRRARGLQSACGSNLHPSGPLRASRLMRACSLPKQHGLSVWADAGPALAGPYAHASTCKDFSCKKKGVNSKVSVLERLPEVQAAHA